MEFFQNGDQAPSPCQQQQMQQYPQGRHMPDAGHIKAQQHQMGEGQQQQQQLMRAPCPVWVGQQQAQQSDM